MFEQGLNPPTIVSILIIKVPDQTFRWFLAVCVGALLQLISFTSFANLDDAQVIDIPAQKLADALIELGSQSEISIVFPSSLPLNEYSVGLSGEYTPRQALDILLADQAIEWRAFNSRVVSLTRKPLSLGISQPVISSTPISEIVVIGEQVTGSRIKRLDWEGSAPVDIITESEISARGVQAISDYLRFIPAVSGNSTSTAVSNGGDGTATITLRGLPAANTLVLLNGRRTANSGAAGDSVDLNSIPLVAVERIEVLKDGASAIYGSDAIAGVVNIILKKEFDGFIVDQYIGQTSRGDLETTNTNIVGGFSTDNSNYMFTATYFDQDAIYSRDRKLSESADGRTQGGMDGRVSATPFTRITLPNDPNDPDDDEVVILADEMLNPLDPLSFRLATDEDLYNYRELTSSVSPSTRRSVMFSAINGVGDYTELVSQIGYTKNEATVTLAPFPVYTISEDPEITVSPLNPYNPFGVELIDLRRRLVELGPRNQVTQENSKRFSTQLETTLDKLHWDIAFSWNKTEANEHFTGVADIEQVRHALDATCPSEPSCVPLDLFGPPGSISQQQLDYIETSERYSGESKMYELNANADTVIEDLWSEPISIASGISRREEVAKFIPEGKIGTTKAPTTNGRRSITEFYLETNIPLIMRQPGIYQLELELATRFSRYSDFGKTNNPKAGLRYRPAADLLFRSTYSEGFRAPSLNQLHQDNRQEFQLLNDPCAKPENVGALPGCTQLADGTIRQFLVVTGGNEDLIPEQALSKTAGIVWTPKQLDELYFSIDWFWIEQSDVIDARSQFIVDQNASFDQYPNQVVRDNNGNLLRVLANNINVGKLNVRGIDATLRYRLLDTLSGNYVLSLNGSHIRDYKQQLDPLSRTLDLAGTFADTASSGVGAIPRFKFNAGISWSKDSWEFNYNAFYVDELLEEIPYSNGQKRNIDSWTTHNIQLSYLAGSLKNIRFTAGIDNIFDQSPPFAASAFNDNFDPRTYEIKGRSWYGQVRYQF